MLPIWKRLKIFWTITVNRIAGAQGIELVKANRSALMRSISAELKGKADMKIVSAVVGDILN